MPEEQNNSTITGIKLTLEGLSSRPVLEFSGTGTLDGVARKVYDLFKSANEKLEVQQLPNGARLRLGMLTRYTSETPRWSDDGVSVTIRPYSPKYPGIKDEISTVVSEAAKVYQGLKVNDEANYLERQAL